LRVRSALLALCCVLALSACGSKQDVISTSQSKPFTVVLDFFPNADHAALYSAIANGDFRAAGLNVQPEAPSDPSAPLKLLAAGKADVAISYEPELLLARDQGLKLVSIGALVQRPLTSIIALPSQHIKKVADLKGKKVSYPARTALAATMMPQYYLRTRGLDVNHDIENLYVGSQESSIMNVYLGNVAAGATWPLPWEAFQKEHPDMAHELELKWETEPMINNGVVARDDVPEQLARRVAQLLDTLHTTVEGKAMLARMPLSRFELADDQRYRVIEDFLHKFSQTVYPLDEPRK